MKENGGLGGGPENRSRQGSFEMKREYYERAGNFENEEL